jgi:hypothetical protein
MGVQVRALLSRPLAHPVGAQLHTADQVGEQVVGVGGALGGLRARPQLGVRRRSRRSRRDAGLLEEPGVLQRHGGVRGEGRQQGDLAGREGAHGAVDGEERADHLALDREGYAEDGADLLARHGGRAANTPRRRPA